jgi:hypothetical protein
MVVFTEIICTYKYFTYKVDTKLINNIDILSMKDNIQIEDFREGLKVETLQATVVKPVV